MVLGFFILPRVPVYLAVGVIFVWQFVLLFLGAPGIAVEAHLAGIGAGILVAPLLRRREPRIERLPTVNLDGLATTRELKKLLESIRAETVSEVREVWIEHFLQKARCPVCGGPVEMSGRKVTSDCGWQSQL